MAASLSARMPKRVRVYKAQSHPAAARKAGSSVEMPMTHRTVAPRVRTRAPRPHVHSHLRSRGIQMANQPSVAGSGDGTRPGTDGGIDNFGAGEKFTSKRNAVGEEVSGGPAPSEGMKKSRRDVEGARHDDSAAFGLNEELAPTPNVEKP